jgi:two-component system OmpR family sensor kinase
MALSLRGTAPRQGVPLSVRLPAIIAVFVVIGLAIVGTATTLALRHTLIDQLDAQLRTTMDSIDSPGPTVAITGPSDYVVGLLDARGRPLQTASSGEVPDDELPAFGSLDPQRSAGPRPEPVTLDSLASHRSWRVLTCPVDGHGATGYMALALPMDSVERTTRSMVLLIVWVTLAVAAVGIVAGNAMVRRALRPLKGVERAASAIAQGNLSTRVPDAAPGTEVGSLTTSLNAMLTQVESAFAVQAASEEQMRTFASDASHELRTPLAAIRGYGELYRMGALQGPDDVAGAMKRIEDEAARMGVLVSDLLTLTRLDEGRPIASGPVNLVLLAVDAAADVGALDPSRHVEVLDPDHLMDRGVWAQGDQDLLRQVVTNLIGNAVRHTPEGSPVELVVGAGRGTGGQTSWIAVRDHGRGIPADQAEHVFERFYRLDASRTRASGGTGLGLAIVASIAAAHHGQVDLTPTPGGGATFRLTLPGISAPTHP